MPTYEYACADCGRRIEVKQSFADAPLTVCEHCGGRLRRVIHPVGVFFRGSGFYSTDHRKGKSVEQEASKSEGKAAKADSKASSGKSKDSAKPAAKSAAEKS